MIFFFWYSPERSIFRFDAVAVWQLFELQRNLNVDNSFKCTYVNHVLSFYASDALLMILAV